MICMYCGGVVKAWFRFSRGLIGETERDPWMIVSGN